MSKRPINFTVDAALLRELGERLVGQPHIALAELVKNAYDADAHEVSIRIAPNKLEISDNGHGMTEEDIQNFWMRIGTPHKQAEGFSRELRRPLTGSKGIGRLAVQFLARHVELHTVPKKDPVRAYKVSVDWDKAVQAGELTKAVAMLDDDAPATKLPEKFPHGTSIILKDLNQKWDTEMFRGLAREIWTLRPPFRSNPQDAESDRYRFSINLESPNPEEEAAFRQQLDAALGLWYSKLVGRRVDSSPGGKNQPQEIELSLEFNDGTRRSLRYRVQGGHLSSLDFEIRIFHLKYRQAQGVKVYDAREYLNFFGGVHVYDAGFHLPYYGRHQDWLDIERDHSHRLSTSKLLPDDLQVSAGLNNLPTQSRIFGVVHVNTGKERAEAARRSLEGRGEHLTVQVSRDRLVQNAAYQALKNAVRWALDYYAMEETRRKLAEAEARRPTEPSRTKIERIESIVSAHAAALPPKTYEKFRKELREAASATDAETELSQQKMRLLGPLATAGMAALAYEHEVGKQFHALEGIAEHLGELSIKDAAVRRTLAEIREQLTQWIEQARATRMLFSPLLDAEDRERVARLRARPLLDQVKRQTAVLTRGIEIDTSEVDAELRLPKGTFAEWSAIFQNAFVNATNAMLDSKKRHIAVRSRARGQGRSLRVLDTGCGVGLESAEELFQPFVRRLKLSTERSAMGMGGMGLGLTIVRMLATNLGCEVAFIEPDEGFNTSFEIQWSEKE
ncbi:ATP-binding protein [Hyalangium rubrum]|uniref:histidine kinase n=1 Tax=Hyalangium rubrum TaxID=3103134 RepID=A0ABU5H6V5_9BACT|nr:ATP-binding protein [Hyalangium sp. s54d21]MDY7229031.1 ATP-binding protein [Hyalangium sp. s54d21]